jgi:hypothetical protein
MIGAGHVIFLDSHSGCFSTRHEYCVHQVLLLGAGRQAAIAGGSSKTENQPSPNHPPEMVMAKSGYRIRFRAQSNRRQRHKRLAAAITTDTREMKTLLEPAGVSSLAL